ncbi:hypothetical protein [Burkholderia vietnamiensis]|jgi:hypothetical protein|uniref:hypothetical protein n=1 Tax=Burkholderia vietnamiensis TaxID=60552 RepID=UPI001041295E|nr:hypothetical protein [Burkholderia vietnamiensis]
MFSENEKYFERYRSVDEVNAYKATQARVRRNRQRGLNLQEKMFSRRSRYLVLFLTLNYKEEHREDVTLSAIQCHRDKLLKYMEADDHSLLGGVQGCIWKLEEGRNSGGLHLHFLIFYSGKHRADVWIAQRIGEYWSGVITRGWGAYRNSNADTSKFSFRWGNGIGQVNRHDESKRDSLRLFIENYMAKANQVPKDRDADDKLFGVRVFD